MQLQPLGTSCGLQSEAYLPANDHSDGGDFHGDGDKKVVEEEEEEAAENDEKDHSTLAASA